MSYHSDKFVLIMWMSILTASCGTANPTDSEGREAFEHAVMEALNGTSFKITEFKKTNGQAAELNGVPSYTLFYAATVEYPDGYRTECLQELRGMQGFQIGLRCSQDFTFSKTPFRPDYPGGFVQVKGTIPFSLTENGWLAGQPQITIVD